MKSLRGIARSKDAKHLAARSRRSRKIKIGRCNNEEGPHIHLTPAERSTHMHVLGPTGKGKSKFLEYMIRQDISAGNGVLVMDPTGDLYDDLVKWIHECRLWKRREIILIDPSADGYSFSYNPLRFSNLTGEDAAFNANSFARAVAQVFRTNDSSASMSETPQLKAILENLAHLLSDNQLTLLESDLYLEYDLPSEVREFLLDRVQNGYVRQSIERDLALHRRDFDARISSTRNRLHAFLSSQRLRRIIGQKGKSLNFQKLMDRQAIILVNLSTGGGRLPRDSAALLGTLLVNDVVIHAQHRQKGSRVPFYLYIDECHRFLTDDIDTILSETRKYGLHCILAHQNLAQLRKAGEHIFAGVMNNAKTKVVFGGLSLDEAKPMVETIFDKDINLEEPIMTLIKPTVVGYEKRTTRNWSDSNGFAESQTNSYSDMSNSGFFSSTTDSENAATTAGESGGSGSSTTNSEGRTKTSSHTEGVSETFVAQLEDRPTQVFSREDQIHKMTVKLRSVPNQNAVIKFSDDGMRAQFLAVPTVQTMPIEPEHLAEIKGKQIEIATSYYTPDETVDLDIRQRKEDLLRTNVTLDTDAPQEWQ